MARSRAETRKTMVEALRRLGLPPRAHVRILDAGMGAGCLGAEIRAAFPNCELTGIDLWLRYLIDPECRQTEGWPSLSLYDSLVGGPEGELLRFLNRAPCESYDAIVMGDVLEHLEPNHALEVLRRAQSVARAGVVVNIPIEDFPQSEVWDNAHEVHRWWQPREWWEQEQGAEYVGGGNGVATFVWQREWHTDPELSIVIAAFNRHSYLHVCLRSLLRTEAPPYRFEIIVVDDGSIDGTDEYVRRAFAGSPVRCVRRTKNVGKPNNPGLARNVGIKAARGMRVAFCDCDVVHCRDVIRATIGYTGPPAILRAYGAWLLEAKAPMPAPDKYIEVTSSFPAQGLTVFRGHVPQPDTKHHVEAQIPAQMWWAIDRNVLLDIGGFDERFTVYGAEDLDMFRRLGRKGLKIHWMPRQFAVGLWAPRKAGPKDVIDIEQNERQHKLWQEDTTIVRNKGVAWGASHPEESE